jgi:hypothetical protein
MRSQNANGGRAAPGVAGPNPGSDIEDLVRQGQNRLKLIMRSGGPRRVIVLAVLALVGLGAWTAYYTVPGAGGKYREHGGRKLRASAHQPFRRVAKAAI